MAHLAQKIAGSAKPQELKGSTKFPFMLTKKILWKNGHLPSFGTDLFLHPHSLKLASIRKISIILYPQP